jgi:hypothetical protein
MAPASPARQDASVPGLGPDAPQGRPPGQGLRSGALMSTGEPRPSKISSNSGCSRFEETKGSRKL